MTTKRKRLERVTTLWGLAGLGLAVLAVPVLVWGYFTEPPAWAAVWGGVCLTLGVVCWVVATVLDARAEQVSVLRVVWRVLSAPFRYLYLFMR